MDKEYIERYNAMKICQQYSKHCFDTNDAKGQDVADKIEWDIIKLSTADVVEVRHGEWIEREDSLSWKSETIAQCSVCGEGWLVESAFPFESCVRRLKHCPNCGAKMDLKEGTDNEAL